LRSLLQAKNNHEVKDHFPMIWSFLLATFPSEHKKNLL